MVNKKKLPVTILIIAVLFLGVVIFSSPQTTYASPATSPVGVVNYQLLLQQNPDTAQAQETYNADIKQAQDDFNTKSAGMNDQDKKALYQQIQQDLQKKQQELLNPIRDKVNAAIKEVADAKGLSVVVDKSVTIYGGQDITSDVLKKITGK